MGGRTKTLEPLRHFLRDLRYAYRWVRKSPALAAASILTLALGIGANTAIFSVFEGVVLKPLPYNDPDRLFLVLVYNRALGYPTYLSYPDFLDWQRSSRSFMYIAAFASQGLDLTSPGPPEHVDGKEVSSSFFGTLGAKLALGRSFQPEEDRTGSMPAVVISNRLWRDRFAGNPSALGKPITLNGVDYTIVGVLLPEFRFERQEADVYTPLGRRDPLLLTDRANHDIACVGRLQTGITLGQARAEMNAIQQQIDQRNPATERGLATFIEPLRQALVGEVGTTLRLLLGAVTLVLLIACANVANLLLGRAATRTREFAIRLALGASRAQILRQLITESVFVSVAGGVLGLAIAKWGPNIMLAAVPGTVPRMDNIQINVVVLVFALGVSLTVGILFGLLPALKSSKTDIHTGLKEGGRGSPAGHHRTQSVLVVVQIGVALVLLTGGGLLFRTILNLLKVKPGFETQNVITFRVGLSSSVNTAGKVRIAYQRLVERVRQIPGVEAADITALVPLSHDSNEGPFWVGSRPPAASMAEIPRAIWYPIGPDYFRTMKIPLLRGRFLTPADQVESEPVVLIDSLLSRSYFPDTDAVGRTITVPHWGAARNMAVRVVGVVGHVEQYGLDGSLGEKPQIYYSFYQLPDDAVPLFRGDVTLVVRTPLSSGSVMPAIVNAVHEVGSDQPIYNVRTVQELILGSMGRQRLAMLLLVAFAVLALLLGLVGTYTVISYSVTRRVREIGIRMALGANKRDVFGMVIGQGFRLALFGVAIGAATALVLIRALPSFSHLLYGVKASDPTIVVGTSALLICATILACYLPARRAAKLEPMVSLRQE
jgi:predicted permease